MCAAKQRLVSADAAVSILADASFRASARAGGPKFIKARFGHEQLIDETLRAYTDAGVPWAIDFVPEPRRHRAYIPLEAAIHSTGYAWIGDLPQLTAWGDDADDPFRSPLVVLEDGKPLGPPHAPHDIIRSDGGGAFSHWEGRVWFSTSDNTDPRSNGRKYMAMIPR